MKTSKFYCSKSYIKSISVLLFIDSATKDNVTPVASNKSSLQMEQYLLEDHVSKAVTTPDMPEDFLTL